MIGLLALCCVVVSGSRADERERLCGPESLLIVCEQLGVRTTLDELLTATATDPQKGTTLLSLQAGARSLGLEAVGVKLSAAELCAMKTTAIAHLWGDHFVAVVADGTDSLTVTDFPKKATRMTADMFNIRYSGFALLVSKAKFKLPESVASGSDMRVDHYVWNFGFAKEGEDQQHAFVCRNVGTDPLVITGVETTSSDLVAAAEEKVVPPGGSTEILVVVTPSRQLASKNQYAIVRCNDPVTPIVRLGVEGTTTPAHVILHPNSLNFGQVRRGESASLEIFLPYSGSHRLRITGVTTDSKRLNATVAERRHKDGLSVQVKLAARLPLGEFRGRLRIHTNHPLDPTVEVPVVARITGPVNVTPDVLFMGTLRSRDVRSKPTAVISYQGRKPFQISKIVSPLDFVDLSVRPGPKEGSFLLSAAVRPGGPPRTVKSEVVIRTNIREQPEIRLPLYVLVED
ncbi:MAG: cysteine peptidase family C39 domain-containing protein [Armatimonadota bacterium]|nr:cysteine peptidase family C39 domain-containing protein [Armatimonadota bacterium]